MPDNQKKPEAKQRPRKSVSAGRKPNCAKKSTGRKCSVCTNERFEEINARIKKGHSFRVISRQILGDEKHHDSIQRHANNCLLLDIGALVLEQKVEQTIDHYQEITEQLEFAKDLRISAREYLSDPDNPGKLVLIPRADEIEIVYLDHNDCMEIGERLVPKKKKAPLSNILEEINVIGAKQADKWSVKHVDIRSFALDAIKTVDVVLDKIARIEGKYQQDKQNESDNQLAQLRKQIEKVAERNQTSYNEELKIFLAEFADKIRPDIREQLSSQLVH